LQGLRQREVEGVLRGEPRGQVGVHGEAECGAQGRSRLATSASALVAEAGGGLMPYTLASVPGDVPAEGTPARSLLPQPHGFKGF